MNKIEVSNSDILLAIIAAADGKEVSRAHLQKVAFLVSEEFRDRLPEGFYKFDKYDYGPFCIDIYNDTVMLDYWGQIRARLGKERRDERYAAADGLSLDDLRLDADIKRYIKSTVAWAIDMSFGQLVRAIYRMYPEYLERSKFRFDEDKAIFESFERGLRQHQEGKTTLASDFLDELRVAARDAA